MSPRILLFDEQSVYRAGLHSLISSNMPRAEVVEANSLNEALSQIRNDAFNLVLLGVNLPGLWAVRNICLIRSPPKLCPMRTNAPFARPGSFSKSPSTFVARSVRCIAEPRQRETGAS